MTAVTGHAFLDTAADGQPVGGLHLRADEGKRAVERRPGLARRRRRAVAGDGLSGQRIDLRGIDAATEAALRAVQAAGARVRADEALAAHQAVLIGVAETTEELERLCPAVVEAEQAAAA